MWNLNSYQQWIRTHSDVLFDLVRIYLGVGLILKAVYFLSHREYLQDLLGQAGNMVIVPVAVAHYVIPAHLAGGLLLAVGLMTRLAALAQIPVLLGAIFYIYLPRMVSIEPRQNLEFSALVLFLLVLIFVQGAGRCSVDHYLDRKT